jgi:class 3 adenylate cyclase/predicted ATPase
MEIGGWLRKLGLGKYETAFVENAIDSDVLLELTEADLEKLRIPLGDRKRLYKAIRDLGRAPSRDSGTQGLVWDETSEASRRASAERRHLTVIICDLVGSTALARRLDPEEMGIVIDSFQAACARITLAYEGVLSDFRGDGILAYFGYPHAHEDDAERAVRAALDIINAVALLKTPADGALSVRIGIASGLVVVGNGARRGISGKDTVIGDTPSIATRIQALAEPGSVVVADSTRRLLGSRFRLRDLGHHKVKGIAEPIAAWAVEGIAASESLFHSAHARELTKLIGREQELDFLLKRQRLAWKGAGQIVLISGEAGIGKSRLAAALEERIARDPHIVLRYQCSPYYSKSPLYPFIAQLQRAAGFTPEDTPKQRLDKLETLLAANEAPLLDTVPLFAALLLVPFGERYPPLALTPFQQRRRIFTALLDQFEFLAHQKPILLLFEDAHWADATSLELLGLAIERMRQLPVLALFTFRLQFEPPWVGLPNVETLKLGPLNETNVKEIIAEVSRGGTLPLEVAKQIFEKTDGNPLYVEELTKVVLEGDIAAKHTADRDRSAPLLAIPATLQDSLMARLDRLGPAKEFAHIGAAIGREFSYSLMRELVSPEETALQDALLTLEQAQLVFRHAEPPESIYVFKHALVRDAAYESILKSRRRQLHGQIARVIETKFPDSVANQPEIVAHHFTEAGLHEPAVDYWLRAGHVAISRSASAAIEHLKQGLKQIPYIENAVERDKFELLLQMALGNYLQASKGWSTDSVKQAYTRALELCKQTGLEKHSLGAVFGLWTWHFVRPSLTEALALANELLNTAEKVNDPVYKVLGHEALGFTLFAQGKFAPSRTELELSIGQCRDDDATAYLEASAQDPRVHVRLYIGMALWFLGYPDQALRACEEALKYADSSQHRFNEAMARAITLRVHQFRGDIDVISRDADAAIAAAEEHGFAYYLAVALMLRGWATARHGELERGIAEIRAGLAKEHATGASLYESYALGLMADACIANGRYEQAFEVLQDAKSKVNSERFYAAEIYRLLGETYLRSHQDLDQAEHWLSQGLAIAREQEAKSLELKIAIANYDLYQLRGRPEQSASQLSEIYGFFSEGLDTADLLGARARLTGQARAT